MAEEVKHFFQHLDSPVGPLTIIANDEAIVALSFGTIVAAKFANAEAFENAILREAKIQLTEYFLGQRKSFNIPVAPSGTEFQKLAWNTLQGIPFGKTLTYGLQAHKLGKPSAARAVGAANGKNPIPIIIPCHRVIGSNGSLTGFLGGLNIKSELLKLEQAHSAAPAF